MLSKDLDSPQLVESDSNFTGFASRPNPSTLSSGIAQQIYDMRLERGSATLRKGILRVGFTGPVGTPIYGSCLFYDNDGTERVVMAGTTNLFVYTPAQVVDGTYVNEDLDFPAGMNYPTGRDIDSTDFVDVLQVNDQVYIFRGRTRGTTLSCSAVMVGPLAAVTTVGSHGYATGDEVTITGTTNSPTYNGSYVITVTSATTFTYTPSPAPAGASTGTMLCVKAKPPLIWNGDVSSPVMTVSTQASTTGTNADCPCGDFALYYQNRLVVPYTRDKVAISDIFDFNTFDLIREAFRVNLGSNDSIVGISPWVGDRFLVFQRRSIYYCFIETTYNTAGIATVAPGQNSFIQLLTDEIGSIARRTIVSVGPYTMFLSDRGVHTLVQVDERNLTVNTQPVSDPIDDWIRRINFSYAQNACAKFWNNRYYIAVPIGDAIRNSHVLVYNILYKTWESVDRMPEGVFVDNWITCAYGTIQSLYFTNSEGGIFAYEKQVSSDSTNDSTSGLILPFIIPATLLAESSDSVEITGELLTRRYEFSSPEEKRFSKADLRLDTSDAMTLQVDCDISDPDSSFEIIAAENYDDDTSITRRARIGGKGCSIEFNISLLGNAPSLEAVSVSATASSRNYITRT